MWNLRVEIFWEFGLDEHESRQMAGVECMRKCKGFGGGDDGRMGAKMVEYL